MSIRQHIPNGITALNLACGTAGIVAVLCLDNPVLAFVLMICGGVFDFFDGFTARALGAYSPMGKELDSLADQVTFGVLPSIMLFGVLRENLGISSFLCWIPLLIAVFSGLRLAKFNIDTRQSLSFLGLPTPACAMLCGSFACECRVASDSALATLGSTVWFIPALSLLLCVLLVCELPMFSMKFHKGEGRNLAFWQRIIFFAVAAISLILAACLKGWDVFVAIFTTFTAYILINVASLAAGRKEE